MARFDDKVVLVTGGAQGMGRAMVERFVEEGACVVLFDIDGELAAATAAEVDDGRVAAVGGDVAQRDDVRRAVAHCLERFGRLDVVVAHAGTGDFRPLLDVDDRTWRRLLDVNLTGVFHCIQEGARAMVAARRGGSIVVTSSTNAFFVEANTAPYNASKGGVRALARSAALDLAPYGIRVNSVSPSMVRTRLTASLTEDPDAARQYLDRVPLRRFAEPVEVANAVLFLASDEASYVTGHDLVLDGGVSIGITLPLEEERLPGFELGLEE